LAYVGKHFLKVSVGLVAVIEQQDATFRGFTLDREPVR
jgi:hypothetical protein